VKSRKYDDPAIAALRMSQDAAWEGLLSSSTCEPKYYEVQVV
jgi:hypothetical protein